VDEALQTTEFDFVKKISADFPIQVLARLLDVPSSDTDQLIDWGNQMVGNTDPDYTDYLITDADSESTSSIRSAPPCLPRCLRIRPRAGEKTQGR
jgi:Cytochrome P450